MDTIKIRILEALEDLQGGLGRVIEMLERIEQKGDTMAADLTSLTAQVAANASVEASALQMINGIAAQLKTAIASNDPSKVQALQDQLSASATALAAAITANTPAATPPAAPAARRT